VLHLILFEVSHWDCYYIMKICNKYFEALDRLGDSFL